VEAVAGEAEVRFHPAVVVAVGEAAELHICPVAAAVADMDKPESAHIAVEVAVAAPAAGNQRVRWHLLLPLE
jgi:hypothetical protein